MELLLYNIYVIGYKYKSIREEEENNTYNLSAWENRKENIMADKKAIIDETQFEAQYDAEAKLLLAQKPFLANILVRTVKDYMGLNPCDVEKLIEGEPYISTIPVEPGFTNSVQIKGMNSENKVRNEGVAYFDILFYVRTSDGLALSISIMFTLIGSEWIFQIYEDYKYITIRGILFQFISLILMFVLVRNSSDLFAYVWITVISCSGANILNAVSRRKYCKIRLTINAKILTHLAPILVLFATSVATTIYTNADTTMLGFFSGNKSVGLYSVSTKIYTIVKQMLAAIIIVSIPRLSAYLGEKKIDYFNRTANQILNALVVIVVPAMVGLIALSKNIVFIIAGQEYVDANISLKILSVALLFSIFSWFYTSCILIPYRCENKVLMATIVAALVNIGLNFILIPTFQQNAAAFTTVIAELLSMVITWWYGRKYFRVSFLKKDILSVAIGCLAIWTICSISEKYISSVLISTVFSVTASVVIYMIVLLIMKNQAVKLVLEILHIKK